MDDIGTLKCFIESVIQGYLCNINEVGQIQIDANIVYNKYMELYPHSKYPNIGIFMRSLNRICKQMNNITTTSERLRRMKCHHIILHSDIRTNCPIIISDMTDFKISFITDMKSPPADSTSDNRINNSFSSETMTPVMSDTKPTDIPTMRKKYPLLESLGINTSFENNEDQLVNLVSELVFLFKTENKPLNFIHRGNDRPGLLVAIPRAKTCDTFERMYRKNDWIDEIVKFLNSGGEDEKFKWICKYIYKKSPHVVVQMATELGLVVCNKMTNIEAAAMWVESNVTITAARTILRHLHAKFGFRLQVPFDQISMLSNVTINVKPNFEEFKYIKKGNDEQIPEIVKYWTISPSTLLELDFARLLKSESIYAQTCYGYDSKIFQPHESGVVAIIGSDHGGGKSRYLIRINYLPSSFRRCTNKVDAGTRTIQFAEVSCKKDVHEIQAKIAPIVNESICKWESSKLIAIKIMKHITCKFLPHDASDIIATIAGTSAIKLSYSLPSSPDAIVSSLVETNEPIYLATNHQIQIWTVIHRIKIVIAGDLSFFATSTGRDGHSHCRCVYCDGSYQSWNDPSSPPSSVMTLPRLHQLAHRHSISTKKIDTKGVVMHPLIEIDPNRYIVPLLHLEIGIVNKLWSSMLHFFDEFVENITELESTLRNEIQECKDQINTHSEEMEVLTVNRLMACEEFANTKCVEVKASIESYRKAIIRQKKLKTDKGKEMKKLKVKLANEQLKRNGNVDGMSHLLYNILEESKIKKQHFHGGAMNGVCCRRLLDNLDVIFEKIKKLLLDVLRLQSKTKKEIDYITLVMDKFISLFETIDVVFFRLRTLDPTEEEINDAKKAVLVLEKLWEDIELKQGPKLHILFDHAIDQVEFFKGIADLVEDFVEKFHQVGKRLDYLVARMSTQSFRQQELVKIRRQWLSSHPLLNNQISAVKAHRKRNNNTHSPTNPKCTLIGMNKQESKKIKREKVERKPYFVALS